MTHPHATTATRLQPLCSTDSKNDAPAAESSSGSTATAVATRPAPVRTPPQTLPPFRVLLHNDDINSVEHVVASICELTTLGRPRAVVVMHEAHTTGVSLLLVTHKERAELYQDQFKSKGLTVTIEPAE